MIHVFVITIPVNTFKYSNRIRPTRSFHHNKWMIYSQQTHHKLFLYNKFLYGVGVLIKTIMDNDDDTITTTTTTFFSTTTIMSMPIVMMISSLNVHCIQLQLPKRKLKSCTRDSRSSTRTATELFQRMNF